MNLSGGRRGTPGQVFGPGQRTAIPQILPTIGHMGHISHMGSQQDSQLVVFGTARPHSWRGELSQGGCGNMGERALATSLAHPASLEEAEDVARRDRANQAPLAESPAIRPLDALR